MFPALVEMGLMSGCDSVCAYMEVTKLPRLIEFVAALPDEETALAKGMFHDEAVWPSFDDEDEDEADDQ